MKKKLFIFFKYIIIIGIIAYVFFNPTARKLFGGRMRIYELNAKIAEAKKINTEYQKRLYYLETKPEYMDRIVKEELEVIAEDEIEYRFE